MSKVVVGDLVWRLVVDPSNANRNLARTSSALKKQEKEMGGILGLLSSKWSILGATAGGVALAMVRASPALSFAMEEVAYRFEYLFSVIGDQFAPLLEDVLIPALDELIPLVEDFAPEIGKMVDNVITGLAPLSPEFDRVVDLIGGTMGRLFDNMDDPKYQEMFTDVVTAISGIASSIMDLAEPAVDALLDIFELIEPFITTVLIVALESLNIVLGLITGFITDVIDELKGDEQLMGVFEQFSDILNDDVIPAIETLGDWIEDLVTWLEESGRLAIAVKNATIIIKAYGIAFKMVADETQRSINKIRILIGWLEKVPWSDLQKILYGANLFGSGPIFAPSPPGVQSGGYIAQSGLAVVHRGEYITPANRISNFDNKEINININFDEVHIASDYDVARMTEMVSRELRRELGILF